jgi:amino acid adenylation domain-containing protein
MKGDNIEDIYELSPAQQGILFHSLYSPDSGVYFVQQCYSLHGNLKIVAFEDAWQQVVTRHTALRTSFYWKNLDKPVQVVHRQVKVPLKQYDWRGIDPALQQEQLEAFLESDRSSGFDLSQESLIRLTLIRLSDDSYQFIWSKHHLILDGWSTALVLKDLVQRYEALCRGGDAPDTPSRPYGDYIAWLQQQDLSKAETFWRQVLSGIQAPTPLISPNVDKPHPVEYDEQQVKLSLLSTAALQSVARQHQLTLSTLVQGAWAILLSRYSREEDVIYGSTVSGRPADLAGAESMVGLFINTLPVRVKVDANIALLPWLEQLQAQLVKMRQYEYSPLVEIQGWSEVPRGVPLFESILVFENYPVHRVLQESKVNIEIQKVSAFDKTNYALTAIAIPGSELEFKISYDRNRFGCGTITRMLGHFQTLLEAMVTNPNVLLKDLPLLTKAEEHQLLVEWNDTQVEYGHQKCIHQLFEEQVERTPDAVAVVFEDEQLTYRELNQQANQIAHYLRKLGVEPEVLVGICMERSPLMLVGLLGILKAGGAYVPLDPAYPRARCCFMLEDAKVSVLLTQEKLVASLPEYKGRVICLDGGWKEIARENHRNPTNETTPENLAYAIYTSGSTGQPKGVEILHRALVNFLSAMGLSPGLCQTDILLSVTTLSFDIAALELYLPLIVGARSVIVSRDIATDGTQLLERLIGSGATVMQATPATWRLLLAAEWQGCEQLKILCGGEALDTDLASELLERGSELWNLYGPTETTIWSAAHKVEVCKNSDLRFAAALRYRENSIIPIGRPIANTQFYVLDPQGQPVAVGVSGELHIGGAGVARRYLHRPELTAQKFIPNPFSIQNTLREGQSPSKFKIQNDYSDRLYRTGDLVRYRADGNLEYLGRIDRQVKVRGFRIELGEIEAVLSQHSAVQETVVLAREDAQGDKRLVAYVVTQQQLAWSDLRRFLIEKLPKYMVPSIFVPLVALPLTPNGKVDRRSLEVSDLTQLQPEVPFAAPCTPIEEMLAGIWTEVLGIEEIGIHDNFFELGGHSLLATRVISQLREVFKIELPLRRLFEKPTVAELAKNIEIAPKAGLGLESPPIKPIARNAELPLSFAQQRLWFLAHLEPDSPFYNIPGTFHLQGQLNIGALEQSLNEVLRRHEVLRTAFKTVEGRPMPVISPVTSLFLPVIDLSELPPPQQKAQVRQLAHREAQQPFALDTNPLLRVKLLRLGEQEYVVLFTMHHMVSDGWSMGILVREIAALYPAFCNGQSSPLPELPIQYADFAAWQRQWLQGEVLKTQLSYWRQHLHDAPALLELPLDHPRPAIQTFQGATCAFQLSQKLSVALKRLSQQEDSTLFMTLLAAFKTLLYRYTGSGDIVVGSPIANRNRSEIEGLIGFFVNTLVLRTNLSDRPTFRELLYRVRDAALEAYTHQDLPFEQLVEALQPQRSLSHTPLFQVMFVLQNAPMTEIELPGLTFSAIENNTETAKFDLTLSMQETGEGLSGTFTYNTDLFEAATIQRMAGHLQVLLEAVVANCNRQLNELPLLTETEKHQLLVEWNDTVAEYPQQKCIHQLFEEQVERSPDAIAVVFEDQQLTYRDLNDRANRIARYLQKLGVGPEVLVGICVERSVDMVAGLLGILKTGGAYVPLDPAYPRQRLAFILSDSQVPVLLTQQKLVAALPESQARVVCLDTRWEEIPKGNTCNPTKEATPENLAYVIYTSGSTGQPKGVQILHGALAHFLSAMHLTLGLSEEDILLSVTTISFDIAALELYLPLIVGVRLVVVSREVAADGLQLSQQLASSGATLMQATPATWQLLLATGWQGNGQLKILCGGEALNRELANELLERGSELWNLYGPTETTIWSAAYKVELLESTEPQNGIVSIGRPISNTQFYILDQDHQPVPVGVFGELHIGGAGLARCYLNREELTAQKFIPNPFNGDSASRLYKTGDLARYRRDGSVEYLGRIDYQVKVRGFRIELGEIEAVLSKYPGVRESVAAVQQDEPNSQRLVAYVVPCSGQAPAIAQLRHFLEERLPNYMIPSVFVLLEALPLTPNGKVDRQALRSPEPLRPELDVAYVMPQTEAERVIADVWQKALNIEKIGIHDNFFELGGHSLLLVQVNSQLRELFKTELSIIEMFRYPTISSLAAYFSKASNKQASVFENDIQSEKLKAGRIHQKNRRQKLQSI